MAAEGILPSRPAGGRGNLSQLHKHRSVSLEFLEDNSSIHTPPTFHTALSFLKFPRLRCSQYIYSRPRDRIWSLGLYWTNLGSFRLLPASLAGLDPAPLEQVNETALVNGCHHCSSGNIMKGISNYCGGDPSQQ